MRRDMSKKGAEPAVPAGSGNIFRDLNLRNADEEQAKVRLAVAINGILENLTQQEAAKRLGTKQPNVSALRNYRLEGFSAERLMHFLNALGHDVEIRIWLIANCQVLIASSASAIRRFSENVSLVSVRPPNWSTA